MADACTGGGTGGTGGGGGGDPVLAAQVSDCAMAPTVKEVEEKIIIPSCGKAGSACHGKSGPFPPDMITAPVYKLLTSWTPATYCKSNKVVDLANPANSLMISKLTDMPKCPDGSAGGDQMPWRLPALPAAEATCLKNYAMAVAAASPK
jgi:hypothetical protein